jgi:hypothetical protein
MAEGLECMHSFTFGLWFMTKDCLGPIPSHKDFPPQYSSRDVGLTPDNQSGSVP